MGMAAPISYSADMVRALPEDGNIYEVVHGELLVNPAPRPWHEVVGARLLIAVHLWLERHPVGHAYSSRSELSWGLRDVLVSPDLFVVPLDEARQLEWTRLRTVLLAAEVLSPSSTRADRFTKRRLYQEQGVPLYWLIDPDAHSVEVWLPEDDYPVTERDMLTWHPAGAAAPFTLPLVELFRPL
jgi:Uma2 family endonuclease